MTSPLPAFQDILNQAAALEQSIAWHAGRGRSTLVRAAALLRQAQQVAVVAIGASYNAAPPFVYHLARAGRRIALEDAAEFLHYTCSGFASPTLFVLISRSGDSIEITRSLERLQGGGHTIIGLTNEPESTLARRANLALLLGGPNDTMVAFQTYLETLLTLDLLAEVAFGGGEPALDDPDFHAELRGMVDAVRQTLEQYDPRGKPAQAFNDWRGVYLLGRGPALGSALEGALMFHEMARTPAQAFSAGAFRHGPWEVADARVRFFVFAPSDETYPLNLALAGDLADLDGEVTLLGSQPLPQPGWKGMTLAELPPLAPRWAPYLEIIPLQFFIFEFARWRGLTPGEFRASGLVTRSETGSQASGASE